MVRQLIYLSTMTVRKAEVVWCDGGGVIRWEARTNDEMGS
jgi:hypothetical protein